MILTVQVQNLLDYLGRYLIGRVLRDWLGINQDSLTILLIGIPPSIKAGPANSKLPESRACISDLFSMFEHSNLSLYIAFFVRIKTFSTQIRNLQEVSRDPVHIYIIYCWFRISLVSIGKINPKLVLEC